MEQTPLTGTGEQNQGFNNNQERFAGDLGNKSPRSSASQLIAYVPSVSVDAITSLQSRTTSSHTGQRRYATEKQTKGSASPE